MTQRLLTLLLALLTWGSAGYGADTDPFPDVNPHAYYGSMMMSVKVMAYGGVLRDIIVAVYSGDEIRGKNSPKDAGNPGVTYLTVYGNQSGEQLSFKVFVKGIIVETEPLLTYTYNGVIGSPEAPYLLDIGPYIHHTGITVQSLGGKHTVSFDSTSDQAVSIPIPMVIDSIAYNRTFVPGQYASVFLPFDITPEMTVTGGEFYRFADITHLEEKWRATMMRVDSVQANHPYLFVPKDTMLTIDPNGHKFTVCTEPWEPEPKNGWTFRGTYEKLVWTGESSDYGFPANGADDNLHREFIRFSDGDYILPLHCYLSYVGDSPSPTAPRHSPRTASIHLPDTVEIYLVDKDGIGIHGILPDPSPVGDDTIYDLRGQIVNCKLSNCKLPRGIYIVNGKKVVIHNSWEKKKI